jgi:hypothetical protein
MSDKQSTYLPGESGRYACTRCGWKWTPRRDSIDPPRSCARCRSAYWQTPPKTARANRPADPKWLIERDRIAGLRRERRLALSGARSQGSANHYEPPVRLSLSERLALAIAEGKGQTPDRRPARPPGNWT